MIVSKSNYDEFPFITDINTQFFFQDKKDSFGIWLGSILPWIFCWHRDKIVHISLQWLESKNWRGVFIYILLFMCRVCVLSLGHQVSEGDLDCVSLNRGLGQMESFVIASDMNRLRGFRKATIFFCTGQI